VENFGETELMCKPSLQFVAFVVIIIVIGHEKFRLGAAHQGGFSTGMEKSASSLNIFDIYVMVFTFCSGRWCDAQPNSSV
jgi:hypothetical protein